MNLPPELASLLPTARGYDMRYHHPTAARYVFLLMKAEIFPRLYQVRASRVERLWWNLAPETWERLNTGLRERGEVAVSREQALQLLDFLRYCYTLGFRVGPWLYPVGELVLKGSGDGYLYWRGQALSWSSVGVEGGSG